MLRQRLYGDSQPGACLRVLDELVEAERKPGACLRILDELVEAELQVEAGVLQQQSRGDLRGGAGRERVQHDGSLQPAGRRLPRIWLCVAEGHARQRLPLPRCAQSPAHCLGGMLSKQPMNWECPGQKAGALQNKLV